MNVSHFAILPSKIAFFEDGMVDPKSAVIRLTVRILVARNQTFPKGYYMTLWHKESLQVPKQVLVCTEKGEK